MIRPASKNRNKLWKKGSKGLATTTQLYTANDIFTIAKYQTTRKLAA